MRRRRTALALFVAAALAGAALLVAAPMRSASAHGPLGWYEAHGAPGAAGDLLRLVAGLGCGWLALASALQLLASVRPWRSVQRVADRVSPAVLRRLAGAAVAAGTALGSPLSAGAGAAGDPPGTATIAVVESPTTAPLAPPAVPVAVPPPEVPAPRPVVGGPAEVRVELGDSFWSLAADALEDERGAPVPEDEVADYWRRLLAANADRLVDPGNADLLLPGQVLVLPPP